MFRRVGVGRYQDERRQAGQLRPYVKRTRAELPERRTANFLLAFENDEDVAWQLTLHSQQRLGRRASVRDAGPCCPQAAGRRAAPSTNLWPESAPSRPEGSCRSQGVQGLLQRIVAGGQVLLAERPHRGNYLGTFLLSVRAASAKAAP